MRVLLVEDNEDSCSALERLLEADGYEVITAADGLAGYEMACRRTPDVIVTDLMMPHLDGFGLIRRLRQNESTARRPVIVISAHDGDRESLLDPEITAYLRKPFDYSELAAALERVQVGMVKRSCTSA